MNQKLLFAIFSFVIMLDCNAQTIYRTQEGNMLITAVSSDTVITLTTQHLLVLLNYETAEFVMKMDKSTFFSGNDSLDKKLGLMKYDIIEYKGNLDLDYIDTKDSSPTDFVLEGTLSTNNKIIKGTGNLKHISSRGTFSGYLTLKFYVKKDDLGLSLPGLNLKDDVEIEIVQAVLNKIEDQ